MKTWLWFHGRKSSWLAVATPWGAMYAFTLMAGSLFIFGSAVLWLLVLVPTWDTCRFDERGLLVIRWCGPIPWRVQRLRPIGEFLLNIVPEEDDADGVLYQLPVYEEIWIASCKHRLAEKLLMECQDVADQRWKITE